MARRQVIPVSVVMAKLRLIREKLAAAEHDVAADQERMDALQRQMAEHRQRVIGLKSQETTLVELSQAPLEPTPIPREKSQRPKLDFDVQLNPQAQRALRNAKTQRAQNTVVLKWRKDAGVTASEIVAVGMQYNIKIKPSNAGSMLNKQFKSGEVETDGKGRYWWKGLRPKVSTPG